MLTAPETPLVRLSNIWPDRQVYAKCEFLAPSGCFKIRGAVHLLGHLTKTNGPRRLVVPSMGNTALGMAVGARAFGFEMTGVVPTSLTRAKDEKLRALGVELIKVEGGGNALLQRAHEEARTRQAYFVHPHLDPLWTDGYRVILSEIMQRLPGCKTLIFPVGGGGLLMGLTAYFKDHPAPVRLIGCEAYNFPTYASYQHERKATIADGLILDRPHAEVQNRIRETRVAIDMVREDEIRGALRDLFISHGLVIEPSSAAPLAWAASHAGSFEEPACMIFTGANIAEADFNRLIAVDTLPRSSELSPSSTPSGDHP